MCTCIDIFFFLLFVKAAKVIGLAMTFTPIIGCAIGTGLIYAALIRGVSYAPDQESTMFNYAAIGFAFVETFMFVLVAVAVAVVFL